MKGKALKIICVGKLRTSYWKEAAEHYLGMLSRWRKIEYVEVRDASSALDREKRIRQEGKNIIAALSPKDAVFALDEHGVKLASRQFAKLLSDCDMRESKGPVFVVGGPYGIDPQILASAFLVSLSPLTFPHELARVLLLEQLFRAESILHNFPYHND